MGISRSKKSLHLGYSKGSNISQKLYLPIITVHNSAIISQWKQSQYTKKPTFTKDLSVLTLAQPNVSLCFRWRMLVLGIAQCFIRCWVLSLLDTCPLSWVLLITQFQCDCEPLFVCWSLFIGQAVLMLNLHEYNIIKIISHTVTSSQSSWEYLQSPRICLTNKYHRKDFWHILFPE